MPKAKRIEELRPQMALPHAAALVLQSVLPQLLRHELGTREGDIEAVHDMRIGSKRLREALRVLSPAVPRQSRKRLLPTVEKLNDLLGQVRDRDVMSEDLGAIMREDARTGGLQVIIENLCRERELHHCELVCFLDKLRQSDFSDFYDGLMQQMLDETGEGEPPVCKFAAEAVQKRLQSVMDHMDAIHDPSDVLAFHRQRIRVKKLKYALEPFLSILPATVKPTYKLIADLQELMGLVHDADVQIALVETWRGLHPYTEGLTVALGTLAARREGLLKQTLAHARKMEQADFERSLQAVLAASCPA